MESLLPWVYSLPEIQRADLFTCFSGLPQGFDTRRGEVFRTLDWQGRAARKKLYAALRRRGYDMVGILCSDEAVMAKWKWALAWQIPAKILIINENCDFFWLDCSHWRTILHFLLFRAGLTGGEGAATLGRIAVAPFVVIYLLGFAAYVHLRRALRT